MRIEGEDLPGVIPGTDLLRAIALGKQVEIGKRVAIIGGGNTAIDAARTALRLGAEEVTVVYRRSREQMPAAEWEIEEAEEEGIRFHFLAAPVEVLGKNGRICSIFFCIGWVLSHYTSSRSFLRDRHTCLPYGICGPWPPLPQG